MLNKKKYKSKSVLQAIWKISNKLQSIILQNSKFVYSNTKPNPIKNILSFNSSNLLVKSRNKIFESFVPPWTKILNKTSPKLCVLLENLN